MFKSLKQQLDQKQQIERNKKEIEISLNNFITLRKETNYYAYIITTSWSTRCR